MTERKKQIRDYKLRLWIVKNVGTFPNVQHIYEILKDFDNKKLALYKALYTDEGNISKSHNHTVNKMLYSLKYECPFEKAKPLFDKVMELGTERLLKEQKEKNIPRCSFLRKF